MLARVVTPFVAYNIDDDDDFEIYISDLLSIISHDDESFSFNLLSNGEIDSDNIYAYDGSGVESLCDWVLDEDSKKDGKDLSETEFVKADVKVDDITVDDEELLI